MSRPLPEGEGHHDVTQEVSCLEEGASDSEQRYFLFLTQFEKERQSFWGCGIQVA